MVVHSLAGKKCVKLLLKLEEFQVLGRLGDHLQTRPETAATDESVNYIRKSRDPSDPSLASPHIWCKVELTTTAG